MILQFSLLQVAATHSGPSVSFCSRYGSKQMMHMLWPHSEILIISSLSGSYSSKQQGHSNYSPLPFASSASVLLAHSKLNNFSADWLQKPFLAWSAFQPNLIRSERAMTSVTPSSSTRPSVRYFYLLKMSALSIIVYGRENLSVEKMATSCNPVPVDFFYCKVGTTISSSSSP